MCVCCWESDYRDAKTDRCERGEGLEGVVSPVRGTEAGAPFISNNRKKAKFTAPAAEVGEWDGGAAGNPNWFLQFPQWKRK